MPKPDPSALREAVVRKGRESAAVKEAFFTAHAEAIRACAQAMSDALQSGGRLLTLGNGGSACDAQHAAVEFMHPILEKRPALPALALTTDSALLSAVGNDQDFSMAFVEQLRLIGRKGDIALGLSTSGNAANVNRSMQAAREMGLLTVGLSGKDGGRLAQLCDHAFVVPSFSTHRIQETHQTLIHILWDLVQMIGGAPDVA
jgi:D-sedoheptulose 7-phosphate isomerase